MSLSVQNKKKEYLLKRLGGPDALRAAVDIFYKRVVGDERLQKFFVNTDVEKLKVHQYNFLSIAFTEIPKDMDVPGLVRSKHHRLFEMGLTEDHFDIVAGHLVGTLQGLGVAEEEVNDAVAVVGPLRSVFVEEATSIKAKKQNKMLQMLLILIPVILALIYFHAMQ